MSSPLDRLPALATTGVGSLPFATPAQAAAQAVGGYELPFCPQLPRLEGDMVHEWLGSDPGRCGWSADRDRQRPAAWHALAAELTVRPPVHRLVKLQVTGPVTLATALERSAGRAGCGPAVLALAREVSTWLAANASDLVRRLRELALDAVLLVDEPGLAQAGLGSADVHVWDPLRGAGAAAWGIHVCGLVPWPLIDETELDVLSFDLGRSGAGRPDVLARLVARGGRVAWGAVDPVAPSKAQRVAAAVAEAVAAVAAYGLSTRLVADRSLLTPACGTGRLSIRSERRIASTLGEAAAAARTALDIGGSVPSVH